MARPKKYKKKMNKAAKLLAVKGCTDKEIAEFFGIKEQTINNWKKKFPLFFESLKAGKEISDAKVKVSLYNRATGFSVPDVHISNYQGEITVTKVIKYYPPDVTACIFWLKNRDREHWRDRQEVEHIGKLVFTENRSLPKSMKKT